MKKTFVTLVLLALIGYVSAQSMRFELNGHVYADGETVECTTPNEWGEYLQDMQLRNLTALDMNVIIEKEVLEDLEGTINYFCWGMCFSPDVFISPNPEPVAANSVTGDGALSFHAMFNDDVFGRVKVRYLAYDERQPDDPISIIVIFHRSGEGVGEAFAEMSHAYPNPASSVVRFNYELSASDNAKVSVYNLLGQEVMSRQLNSLHGQVSFSVADLNDGIYFCNLYVNGQSVKTEKFVVRK